jgi:uncharacterized membrane protein
MEAKAKLLGHPIHQMLVVFPLGLLAGSVVFDIIYLVRDSARWADLAYWCILFGLISGVVAAVFGVLDWTKIPKGTRAQRIGAMHGVGNLVVVVIFIISFALRAPDPTQPGITPIILSFLGFALAGVTGWLGGELVDRLGVGVDDGAHLDAPSSLTHRHAQDGAGHPTRT